jgi:hypothetical protein
VTKIKMPLPLEDVEMEDDYASSEDEDFVPDVPAAGGSASASEDSESDAEPSDATKPKARSKKRKVPADARAEDLGYDNSGDEAIIGKGLKKAKRAKRKGVPADEDDEGGEGGFVKTRRQAAQMQEESTRKLQGTEGATVDVDKLWTEMMSGSLASVGKPSVSPGVGTPGSAVRAETPEGAESKEHAAAASKLAPSTAKDGADGDEYITIKRTFRFAGETQTETKRVLRSSAEARLYLAENPEAADGSATPEEEPSGPKRRPTKLARRSIFEPIPPAGFPVRPDLNLGVGIMRERLQASVLSNQEKGRKLNTVEKSKMDWAGFVDKEGIREELEKAGKSKDSYIDRRGFLDRVEQKKDEEARAARLATRGLAT